MQVTALNLKERFFNQSSGTNILPLQNRVHPS